MSKGIFYFSDYFKPIFARLTFAISLAIRFLIMIFRRRRGIKLLGLDYSKKYLFDKSYLIVHYKFKNALWYEFKNVTKTTNRHKIVFNLEKLASDKIILIVHGFFQKKVYYIHFAAEKRLESKSLKIGIRNLDEKKSFALHITIRTKNLLIKLQGIKILKKAIKTFNKEIQINHSLYNQTDFL